ncbi:MAG: type II secretion system minor pseudopilin GspI [Sphingomonadaceae bacterium]
MYAARGFTLVEVLVALLLLGLVGLTLLRFQTLQINAASRLGLAAIARLEADNRAVDLLAASDVPESELQGVSQNAGRQWHWRAVPGPSPDPQNVPGLATVTISVAAAADQPPLATRQILKRRTP